MRFERNLLAGLANSMWSALISFAIVPLYLKYLGIEAYGLIGFFITTQALFQLLDMGLAPTINREIARSHASGSIDEGRKLLHTLAVIYVAMAMAIAIVFLTLAPLIAEYWLQSKQLQADTVSHAVMLMVFVMASRWPIALYQGALMGAQRIVISSGINIAMVTVASLGAVVVLAYVSATIEAFFIWQAVVGLVYAEVMRRAAWRVIGKGQARKFDWNALKQVWRFSAGMSVVALSGIIFTQLDKVILSKMLGLTDFGHYMLATMVITGMYALVTPFFNVVYPRFSALVVNGDVTQLKDLYKLYTQVLAVILFPLAMFLAVFAESLLTVWVGNAEIAVKVAPLITFLALGSALHGVMYLPYALQLAYGQTRLPVVITLILMVLLVPLIVFMTLSYGAQGAAKAWLILHIMYLMIGTWMTHRYLLRGLALEWLFRDVGMPLAVTSALGLLGVLVVKHGMYSDYEKLLFGMGLSASAVMLSVALSRQLANVVLSRLRRVKTTPKF